MGAVLLPAGPGCRHSARRGEGRDIERGHSLVCRSFLPPEAGGSRVQGAVRDGKWGDQATRGAVYGREAIWKPEDKWQHATTKQRRARASDQPRGSGRVARAAPRERELARCCHSPARGQDAVGAGVAGAPVYREAGEQPGGGLPRSPGGATPRGPRAAERACWWSGCIAWWWCEQL